MKALVVAGIALLASCHDSMVVPPQAAPVAPSPVPPAPPKPRPAPRAPAAGVVTAMDLATLFTLQQAGGVLLYDVRPGFVLSFGRIPGAISWPRREFTRQLASQEPRIRAAAAAGNPLVLYCTDSDCPDARAMADQLAGRGHDVSVLSGGYAAWKDAGLPTE
jgi:adenylyltransferase/sulfurtransferase